MAYHLRITEPASDYLSGIEGLTREERLALHAAITFDLRDDAEGFVTAHLQRQESPPDHIRLFLSLQTSGGTREFGFVVDVRGAAVGVLALVYCDEDY